MTDHFYGTGRRKTSTARVYLRPGSGTITVNGRTFEDYFPNDVLKMVIRQPLETVEKVEAFDITATVAGGGPTGQAGAIRLAISRAIQMDNPEARGGLKKAGYLRRDSRMVERKKYGLRKARRGTQFSKR